MDSSKVLTVIVAAYNMERFLPRCLDSMVISPEAMGRLEILIINDGSTDGTSRIAHGYESQYPRTFAVVDKSNGNYGSCIERGLSVASGLYVKTIDADDWVNTENFEKYIAYIISVADNGTGPDLIINDFEFVDEAKNTRTRKSYSFVMEPGFNVAGFTYKDGRDVWMHAVAYKTAKLRNIGYTQMHGVSYTDEEWISLPMTTVETIGYFPEVVYEYLLGRQGQTCAPDEYLKGFWMQILILKKLITQYVDKQGQWGRNQEIYMHNHLLHRLELTYRTYLLTNSKYLDAKVLVDFDVFLCDKSPQLYGKTRGFQLEGWYKYPFVAAWGKNHRKNLVFAINVLFVRILRKFFSAIKHIKMW